MFTWLPRLRLRELLFRVQPALEVLQQLHTQRLVKPLSQYVQQARKTLEYSVY
jgi:hypothetical protein